MIGVKALGVPQKQQLLLFKEIVVAHPRLGNSQTQAELDYLESQNLVKRIDLNSLLNASKRNKVDETILDEACCELIATECSLFGGETEASMVRDIFNNRLEEYANMPRGSEINVDHPGSDTMYNDLTRIITSTIRHALKLDTVGLLVEDRSKHPDYKGYQSRMAFTRPRRELPKSLQKFAPERERGETTPEHTEAVDWLEHHAPPLEVTPQRVRRVFNTVLQNVPIPSEDTAYEDIISFRNDPETKERFLLFQYWIRDAICSNRSVSEISEELEWLNEQYATFLKRHGIKFGAGVLRVAMSFGAELVENAVKFRLKSLVNMPFQLVDEFSKSTKSEIAAPGRQISYLQHAHKTFRR